MSIQSTPTAGTADTQEEKIMKTPQQQAVEGIVRIIRHIDRKGEMDFGTLITVGTRGMDKDSDARAVICEFVKDCSLTDNFITNVVSGNYESVWRMVNYYMKRWFGLKPVEPVELDLLAIT